MGKYIIIDGVEYPIAITSLQRKADILDKTANRTEDGDLHREVIGTFYNYSLKIYQNDPLVYEMLWDVLTAPVPFHLVELPHDHIAFEAYFSSVQDEVEYIRTEDGYVKYKALSCNCTSKKPRRMAGES